MAAMRITRIGAQDHRHKIRFQKRFPAGGTRHFRRDVHRIIKCVTAVHSLPQGGSAPSLENRAVIFSPRATTKSQGRAASETKQRRDYSAAVTAWRALIPQPASFKLTLVNLKSRTQEKPINTPAATIMAGAKYDAMKSNTGGDGD